MSASEPDPVGYLAACHEADSRSSSVYDLLHKDVQHRHFATGNEVLVTGLQEGLAIPTEKGLAALKAAATYKREKSLIYAAFLVVGQIAGSDGSERKLCAPVVYYPARLKKTEASGEDVVYLSIAREEQTVNFPLFAELLGEDGSASDVVERIAARVPTPPFDELALSELMQIFRDFLPGIEVDAMYRFPELVGEKGVRKARTEGRLECVPSATMALISNPKAARGVLFELATEELRGRPSTPIRVLFGEQSFREPEGEAPPVASTVPAVLSAAQQKTLKSARREPLTLIVGPPGTGKSFTVSAVAVDHVLRGKSVLIACRTDRALDVIESKLHGMLGDTTTILRGGSGDDQRELKRYLKRLLSDAHGPPDKEPKVLERRLIKKMNAIRKDENRLKKQTALEHAWGELAIRRNDLGLGILDRLRLAVLDFRVARAAPHWEVHGRLTKDDRERVRLASELLRVSRHARIATVLDKHRPELKRFLDAMRARTSSRQERLFGETDLSVVLQAFPLWMSTFRDLHRLVPFERELFDLVIIDEATQSDMASPLPVLYRARRAVVTGDPEQLRHVSFLPRHRQNFIADEFGLDERMRAKLDYRDESLLDLVDDALASQDQVAFLDEHFRSMPQIIEFSNREIYGGALHVMTARPETLRTRAVEIRHVGGRRAPSGVNIEETNAVIEEILRRIESQKSLDASACHSIGVLSPFRDQVDYLSKSILDRFDLESIEKHDLLIGTAYGFQGEERDVMLLSLVVDAESHPTSFRYLSQPDVFNVSITRARVYQILFTSFLDKDVPHDGLLARYLDAMAREPHASLGERKEVNDAFLRSVMHRLSDEGFQLWPAYAVAGTTVDLVVERNGRVLGIDLVGYPGEYSAAVELERCRMFARAGLSLFPLPYSAWKRDPDACTAAIVATPC